MIGYQTNGIRECKHRMARIVAWQNKPNASSNNKRRDNGGGPESPPCTSVSCFQEALLGFFLALDTVASPGNGFEPLGINLFAA